MEKPYVICHILASVDGKIDGDFMSLPENAACVREYGKLRDFFDCGATLYGTTTMQESYSNGIACDISHCGEQFPREDFIAQTDFKKYVVAIDAAGILSYDKNYIDRKNRPKAHIIEVLTENVSDDYLGYLHGLGISYIFCGKNTLVCELVLHKLKTLFGIDKLMISGGGIVNNWFLQSGLIDELSLLIAPAIDGGDGVSAFEASKFLTAVKPFAVTLKDVVHIEYNGLWLRYSIER